MSYHLLFANILLYLGFIPSPPVAKHNSDIKFKIDFYTAYNQFYISDQASQSNTGSDDFWTQQAYDDHLATGGDVVGVAIQSYGHVKGELHILDKEPEQTDFGKYDHVVEAGIKIESGVIQILNSPDYIIEFKTDLKPGTYRIRIYSAGLNGVDIDEDEGQDHYRIELWPDTRMERKVLKQFSGYSAHQQQRQ